MHNSDLFWFWQYVFSPVTCTVGHTEWHYICTVKDLALWIFHRNLHSLTSCMAVVLNYYHLTHFSSILHRFFIPVLNNSFEKQMSCIHKPTKAVCVRVNWSDVNRAPENYLRTSVNKVQEISHHHYYIYHTLSDKVRINVFVGSKPPFLIAKGWPKKPLKYNTRIKNTTVTTRFKTLF